MEISVKLPDSLYQDVSHLAQAKKKSVAEIIKNAVKKAAIEDSVDLKNKQKLLSKVFGFVRTKKFWNWQICRCPLMNA